MLTYSYAGVQSWGPSPRNYHQILPIIAEKVHQEKVQQEKLKAVKVRLNFEEASHHSESGTPIRRRGLKERLRPRYVRSQSGSPKPRRGRSESPKKKGLERKAVFKRLEKGVFHRLGDKGKSVSVHSDDSRRWASSRRTEELSESEGSAGGHWKSKLKRQKSSIEDDLSQPGRDGESTEEFVRRYKLECRDMKGAPECMRISGFMHGITNPELIKRLHDKIPKSVDKMMRVTTAFLRGEMTASNHERKKSLPSWKHQEANQKQNFKKEASGTNKGRKGSKIVGHNIDECMHLRKKIKEMLKAGKLSHLIKELKQNNGKEQPKVTKKGETPGKDKALAILMVQPWERVARQRITQSFSPNP
ncbi:hypothetical protein Tco_1219384 [Tanacetum coccineum]